MREIPLQNSRMIARHLRNGRVPFSIEHDSNSNGILARVRDVSVLGVAFLTSERIAPGDVVTARTESDGTPFEIPAEVRHASPLGEGQWLIGCRFTRMLSMDEILSLA